MNILEIENMEIDSILTEIDEVVKDTNCEIEIMKGRQLLLFVCLYGMAKRNLAMKSFLCLCIAYLFKNNNSIKKTDNF